MCRRESIWKRTVENRDVVKMETKSSCKNGKRATDKQLLNGEQNFIAILYYTKQNRTEHQTTTYITMGWQARETPRLLNIETSINNQPMERKKNIKNKKK